MVDSWDRGNSITLKAYSGYPTKEISKVNFLTFKFIPDSETRLASLKSGDVDVARIDQADRAEVEKTNKYSIYDLPSAGCTLLAYNFRMSFFRDIQVRRGLNFAVDREGITNDILDKNGMPAYSLLQVSEFRNDSVERYDYSLQNANNSLTRAGWDLVNGVREKDFRPLEFAITVNKNNKQHVVIANALATQFQRVGVRVSVKAVNLEEIDYERSDAVLIDVGSQYDPDNYLYDYLSSTQIGIGKNYGKFEDTKIDAAIDAQKTAIDAIHRKSTLKSLQKALSDNPPYNYIAFPDSIFAVSKKVKNIKLPTGTKRILGINGDGFFLNIGKWEVMTPKEYGVTITPTATPTK